MPRGASGPITNDGLTIDDRQAPRDGRSASSSASCFEFTYVMPRWPIWNDAVSSIAPFGLADADRADRRGVDHALDPGRLAPPRKRCARRGRSCPRPRRGPGRAARSGRRRGKPARRLPCARRTARRSVTSPVARSNSMPLDRLEIRAAACEHAQLVAALGERAGEMRADEPRGAGDQGLPIGRRSKRAAGRTAAPARDPRLVDDLDRLRAMTPTEYVYPPADVIPSLIAE